MTLKCATFLARGSEGNNTQPRRVRSPRPRSFEPPSTPRACGAPETYAMVQLSVRSLRNLEPHPASKRRLPRRPLPKVQVLTKGKGRRGEFHSQACECRTSPGRDSPYSTSTGCPIRLWIIWISSIKVVREPKAKLVGLFVVRSRIALVRVSTTVPTYVKSRLCSPSP